MPFSSGTFSRVHDFTDDRDNGIRIQASRMDAEMDGIATGLSTALLKDGTQTATATIPFAAGISIIDNQKITLGTNSDITLQYDETTNDSLEIAANVEGAALGIVLKSDQGDDNADQHKLSIADGGVLTLGSKISGSFVDYLTHTPNSTVASSTLAVAGNLTVGGNLTLGSGAVLSEAELEQLDGITAGTVTASKAVVVDANKDIASFRNITLTGELDAGSLDISGDADIDGTLEADAMTLNGSAITTVATLSTGISNGNLPVFTSGVADDDFLRVNGTSIEGRSASEVLSDIGASAVAGSSSIVTTGALDSGSITSNFGNIDNGTSTLTTGNSDINGTLNVQGETTLQTHLNMGDNDTIKLGANADLQIYHDGSHSYVQDNGTGNIRIKGANIEMVDNDDGGSLLQAVQGGAVTLYHNNSAKLDTTSSGVTVSGNIANASGNLTIDVAGQFIVNSDSGQVVLQDDTVNWGNLQNSSGDFVIESLGTDKDMIFKGLDGSSVITALTLDMSVGGFATLANGLDVADGNISFAAGHGIDFSNASGSASGSSSALLDDYEEGSFTPNVGGNATYSIQIGKYIKIGNLVHCTATMEINSLGTGSTNLLLGLPFAASNHGITAGAVNVMYYANLSQGHIWISGYVRNANDSIYFSGNTLSSTTIQHNSQSIFQNSARVDFNVTYSSG
jgi:hypothetical protein